MLLASIFFWEGSTNTFQFPYGMLTLTLFGITTIMGLNPIGETFTPMIEIDNEFVFEPPNFKNYITDHHEKKTKEVSDQEHISFLTLWLSYFCCCSS